MRMKLLAFVRRDWLIYGSYRVSLVFTLGQMLVVSASFFFIGKLVDPSGSPALAPYGGAYFPFVLLGLAFSRYLSTSLSSFAGNMRDEQLQGTLEAMLATPTRPLTIILGGVILEFLWTTVEVVLYLAVGALVFGVDLSRMNVPATMVLLGLTLCSLMSFGVLSAGGILLFKEFNPIAWVLGGLMKLVGGVYFPVAILPAWLSPLAKLFPLTYGLEGLRQAVLNGKSLGQLQSEVVVLAIFSAVLWPLAIASFSFTLRRLKQAGALSFR